MYSERKNNHFGWFWDEPVDRLVIRLDTVASNLENQETDRPIGLPIGLLVFRLGVVAASYYTKGKQSTGWLIRWSSGWMQ